MTAIIFMSVVLKIPVLAMIALLWWASRPEEDETGNGPGDDPPRGCPEDGLRPQGPPVRRGRSRCSKRERLPV